MILEILPTSPAHKISLEIAFSAWMPSGIVRCKWEVVDSNKEWCRETIVMLPMFHGRTVPVNRYHMDMEMVHGRMGMHAAHDLLCPISSGREGLLPRLYRVRIDAVHCFLSRTLLFRDLAMSAAEFVGSEGMQLGDFRTDFRKEFLVFKGIERMLEGPRWIARQEQKMKGGFGVFVMDSYEIVIMVDDNRWRKRLRTRDVFA